jgi:iron(III) transport system permease protein
MLFRSTFTTGFGALSTGFTFDNYIDVFTNVRYYDSLKNTLLMAGVVTLVATMLGVILAWIVGRTNTPTSRVLELLIILPLFVSPFLGGLGWGFAVRPGIGVVGNLVEALLGTKIDLFTGPGVMWVLSLYMTPYAYIFIVSSLRSMDPALEEAASLLGLGIRRTATRITIPLMRPAILSATLLIFVSVSGQFGVPILLGAPGGFFVITTRIFFMTKTYPVDWSGASTLSIMLLVITIAGVYLQVRALGMGLRRFATITGRGYRHGEVDLGAWRYAAAILAWLFVVLSVIIPIGTLIYSSFLPEYSGEFGLAELTLDNYRATLVEVPRVRSAFAHSLLYSTIAATITVLLTAIAAWIIYRSRLPGRRFLEYVCMLPLAIPSTVLAVAFLWTFIQTPAYGTMWILILAYVAAFIPFGLRAILPSMSQIEGSLEEGGRMVGLGWFRIFGRIILPLTRSSLVAAWLLLFMIFIKELSSSIMLYTDDTYVISVSVYDFWAHGVFRHTAAIASAQIALIAMVAILVGLVAGRQSLTRGMQ